MVRSSFVDEKSGGGCGEAAEGGGTSSRLGSERPLKGQAITIGVTGGVPSSWTVVPTGWVWSGPALATGG